MAERKFGTQFNSRLFLEQLLFIVVPTAQIGARATLKVLG